jgi:hypothetical protein
MLSDLRHRRLAVLASSAAIAVAAGCGSATKNGAGSAGKDGEAAKAFPASTLAFVDADTDTSSAAWTKMLTVLRRFPSWPKAEAKLQAELAKPATQGAASGASFAQDVEPWLGSEAAVGVVGVQVAASPKPTVLGYVASKDDAKAKDFVANVVKATAAGSYKGYDEFKRTDKNDTMFAAVGKGVVLVGSDEATLKQGIDTREGGGDALAGSSDYKATLDKLPSDSAAVAYVNGKELGQLLQLALASGAAKGTAGAAAGMLGQSQAQLANLRGIGFSVGADANGFRIRSVALGNGSAPKVAAVASELRAAVPGDAFAYGAIGATDAFAQALTGGAAAQQQQLLQGLQAQTGLDLPNDLQTLLGGGLAFYVAPGTPVRGGIVLHPADAAKAADVMHRITAAVAKFAPAVKFTPISGGTGEETTVNGLHIAWQKTGETFTVSVEPGAASGGTTGGFDANETYKRLIGEVGGASGASGELVVDVQKIVDAATAAGATISPEGRTNLSHLGGIAAVTKSDGDAQTLDALVEVR